MSNGITVPSYCGKETKDLLNRINERFGNTEALKTVIAFGTAIAVGESFVGTVHDIEAAAHAIKSLDAVALNRNYTEIELLLGSRVKLDPKEREFLEKLDDVFHNPDKLRKLSPPKPLVPDPSDPNRRHAAGDCWCGSIHPPHEKWVMDCDKAPMCWCQQKHCGAGAPR